MPNGNALAEIFPGLRQGGLLQELQARGLYRHFDEETCVLSVGTDVTAIPLVLRGNIRVLREDPSGREILLYYIKPGESCIMSILAIRQAQHSQVTAIAAAQTEVLLIPAMYLSTWSQHYPAWNEFVQNIYHTRFEELIGVVNELAFSRMDQRLVELLRTKAQLHNSQTLSITHQQLADELGTAREVVSRLLKKLEQEDRLHLGRGKINLKEALDV